MIFKTFLIMKNEFFEFKNSSDGKLAISSELSKKLHIIAIQVKIMYFCYKYFDIVIDKIYKNIYFTVNIKLIHKHFTIT